MDRFIRTGLVVASLTLLAATAVLAQRGQSAYCEKAQARWQEASCRARLAFYQVETNRQAIRDLEEAWGKQREQAYGSASVDVAFLAASVLTKPITLGTGVAAATKEGLEVALIDAALTGMVKEGLKQYEKILVNNQVDPQEALRAMVGKGGENAEKKAAEKLLSDYLERRIMEKVQAGEMGPIDRLWTAGAGGVDQTMRGTNPDFMKEYCRQVARTVGLMVSLGLALRGAWTNQGKLEDIRLAIAGANAQLARRTQAWERRKEDLEVAAYARDECEKLKAPGRVDDGLPGRWSGNWASGTARIAVTQSGDTLSYDWANDFGEAPGAHYDKGHGECRVTGDTAKGTWTATYHDADKDMLNRHGTTTLKISGDSIANTNIEDGETPVWRTGKYDSAMHPGAVFSGTWTRKGP